MTDYNELVRCGECKFWSETEKGFGRCLKSGFKTPKDFLGEDGERKDQGVTEYTKLVAAVRDTDFGDTCVYCEHSDMCKDADCIILQAAAAIEALQAEVERLQADVDAAYAH